MTHYPNQTKPLKPLDTAARRIGTLAALTIAVVVASPQLVTVSRAVANLPVSAVAVAWGRTHGGTCNVQDDLTVTCESMHSGYANAGTTVGNVWLYGAESARTGGYYNRNVFERWAGLHDGGYLP